MAKLFNESNELVATIPGHYQGEFIEYQGIRYAASGPPRIPHGVRTCRLPYRKALPEYFPGGSNYQRPGSTPEWSREENRRRFEEAEYQRRMKIIEELNKGNSK